MTTDDKEIVSAILSRIAGRVGQQRLEMWLGNGAEVRLEDRKLHILLEGGFKLERLRRGRKEILAAAAEVLGYEPELVLAVNKPLPLFDSLEPPAADVQPAAPSEPILLPLPLGEGRGEGLTLAANAEPEPSFKPYRRPFAQLHSFIVGDGNRVAHAAALSVLPQLGQVSPVLLYGPPGCGKSHLLEGIWCQAKQSQQVKRVIYLTAEQFTTHFVEAIKGAGLPSFRRKYREVELLLIDDVQFFAGKQSTLVEFLHTIDTLLREGRQLIFAADRPPSELRPLGPENITRHTGGQVCGKQSADYATRLEILRGLAAQKSLAAPEEVLGYLAAQLPGDARQLAGAMHRLAAAAFAYEATINLEFVQHTLADLMQATRRAVRLPEIAGAVCSLFGLEPEQMQSGGKSPAVSHPRMLAMWLARKYTRSASSEISRYFGRKSHSTVLSAEDKVTQWLASGKTLPLPHGQCTVEEALRRVEAQLRLG
ncbi:MAG: ATP-binding protein [Pirellulaceae bacterium]|nr:ATP-binding protein [Pirellulaceae bacterium]